MLDEYVSELKQSLKARRDADASAAIANGDAVVRGKVQGLDYALAEVDELFQKYLEPAEEPPAIKQWAKSESGGTGGRRFGARRVA